MPTTNKYKLTGIKALMLLSQLLLLCVGIVWLYTQYKAEKEQLTEALQISFVHAQEHVADSLVFKNMVGPMLAMELKGNKDTLHIARKHITSINSTVELFVNNHKLKRGELDSVRKILKRVQSEHEKEKGLGIKQKFDMQMYDVKDGKTAEGMLRPMISLIVRQMTKGDVKTTDSMKMGDSVMLQKVFAKQLQKDNKLLSAIWVNKLPAESDGKIYLQANYMYRQYYVGIGNYMGYLLMKIWPEILFTFFLLAITATAFIVTYRMLKQQIKLGVIKNDLISNMSHELNTPISTVKVALEALGNYNRIDNPNTTRDYLDMATQEMNRLDMLVKQTLNAALADEGRLHLSKTSQDIRQLAEQLVRATQMRAQEKKVSIYLDAADEALFADIDALHLQGVLMNLIDNSIKYSAEPVQIQLALKEEGNSIVISVSDNGPGIPVSYIDNVFDKFFRAPTGDVHNVKGYGLGLSYAKQIIDAHNGTISVTNNMGKGCTFTIRLPKRAS